MKNSSLTLLIVAAGIASGCGARTGEDDILDYSRPVQTGGNAGVTGGSGGQPIGGTGGGSSGSGTGGGIGGNGNDCCTTSSDRGCRDPSVQECVCQADSFCCNSHWDQACVDRAEQSCGTKCFDGTGGFTPTGGASPTGGSSPTGGIGGLPPTGGAPPAGGAPPTGGVGGSPPGGDCCSAHPGQGCQVTSVQQCVCGDDPYCCNNNWDNLCAERAVSCGADCGMGGTGGAGTGGAGTGGAGTGGSMGGTGGFGTGGAGTATCVDLFPGSCGSCLCTKCFNQFTQCLNDQGCNQLLACALINSCACDGFF